MLQPKLYFLILDICSSWTLRVYTSALPWAGPCFIFLTLNGVRGHDHIAWVTGQSANSRVLVTAQTLKCPVFNIRWRGTQND